MLWTILASVNLICALLAYSFLAYALAQLHWRGHGIIFVLFAIIISGQAWLIPQWISSLGFRSDAALFQLWFGDWLVVAFSIVLFCVLIRNTTRDRADAARMDGCGPLGIYWHVVLPLVRPALVLLGILTIMATWIEFATSSILATKQRFPDVFPVQSGGNNLCILMFYSLGATLPLIGIFLLAQRCFRRNLPD